MLVVLGAAAAARAETHSDEALGYSVQPPQDWRPIPIAGEEKYIVARWQSDREYADKEGYTFRPEMKVILFDPNGKKVEVQENVDGSKEIEIVNPYKTYQDWVKSDASGGRYISKQEEIKVNGLPTTWYEVAYEKLTVARHGLAFVYHSDIDYCVTTEVLEQNWQKLSPMLVQCLKSFKVFPRKGSTRRETTDGSGGVVFTSDMAKQTPEQRFARRQADFEKQLRLAGERLTEGWSQKRSKHYVVFTHADEKYTNMILEQAEEVREWAEARLGFVGTGIPGSELLRICKDSDEERAFQDLSSRSSGWVHEIVLSRSDRFWGLGTVAGEIFDRWLSDKNPRLAYSMPPWLGNGIRELIATAYIKGGRLEFFPDVDTIIALRLAVRDKKLIPPREMVQLSWKELSDRDDASGDSSGGIPTRWGYTASAMQQSAGLVRYLLIGPGKSNARTKDFLECYVTNLDAYIREQDDKPLVAGEAEEAPKTEAEEEERYRNRKTFWKDHEKDLMQAVYQRAFSAWTDKDWDAVDKSFRAFAR